MSVKRIHYPVKMLPIRNQSELLNKNSKLVTSNSLQYIKYTTGTLLQG